MYRLIENLVFEKQEKKAKGVSICCNDFPTSFTITPNIPIAFFYACNAVGDLLIRAFFAGRKIQEAGVKGWASGACKIPENDAAQLSRHFCNRNIIIAVINAEGRVFTHRRPRLSKPRRIDIRRRCSGIKKTIDCPWMIERRRGKIESPEEIPWGVIA